jgi:hypothetical protein
MSKKSTNTRGHPFEPVEITPRREPEFDANGYSALALFKEFFADRYAEALVRARVKRGEGMCRESVSDWLCRVFVRHAAEFWLPHDSDWPRYETSDGDWKVYVPSYAERAETNFFKFRQSRKGKGSQVKRNRAVAQWRRRRAELLAAGWDDEDLYFRALATFNAIAKGKESPSAEFKDLPLIPGKKTGTFMSERKFGQRVFDLG